MQLSRNTKIALGAFLAFDLLLAIWLVYLFLVRSEIDEINDLRDLGATRYPAPTALQDIQLMDKKGNIFTEANFQGQWSLVFFGFTSCPDVCPLTMAELDRFYSNPGNMQPFELPQMVFVTVDPGRDGPAEVGDYVEQYNELFIGLTGTDEQIARAAAQFYVAYEVSDGDHSGHGNEHNAMPAEMNPDDYRVDHNTHVSLVNPQGELAAVIRPPIREEVMRRLYPQLVAD